MKAGKKKKPSIGWYPDLVNHIHEIETVNPGLRKMTVAGTVVNTVEGKELIVSIIGNGEPAELCAIACGLLSRVAEVAGGKTRAHRLIDGICERAKLGLGGRDKIPTNK